MSARSRCKAGHQQLHHLGLLPRRQRSPHRVERAQRQRQVGLVQPAPTQRAGLLLEAAQPRLGLTDLLLHFRQLPPVAPPTAEPALGEQVQPTTPDETPAEQTPVDQVTTEAMPTELMSVAQV